MRFLLKLALYVFIKTGFFSQIFWTLINALFRPLKNSKKQKKNIFNIKEIFYSNLRTQSTCGFLCFTKLGQKGFFKAHHFRKKLHQVMYTPIKNLRTQTPRLQMNDMVASWYSGMILASSARGPGFKSWSRHRFYSIYWIIIFQFL